MLIDQFENSLAAAFDRGLQGAHRARVNRRLLLRQSVVAQNWLGAARRKISRMHMQILRAFDSDLKREPIMKLTQRIQGSRVPPDIFSSGCSAFRIPILFRHLFAAWLQLGWQGRGESPWREPWEARLRSFPDQAHTR